MQLRWPASRLLSSYVTRGHFACRRLIIFATVGQITITPLNRVSFRTCLGFWTKPRPRSSLSNSLIERQGPVATFFSVKEESERSSITRFRRFRSDPLQQRDGGRSPALAGLLACSKTHGVFTMMLAMLFSRSIALNAATSFSTSCCISCCEVSPSFFNSCCTSACCVVGAKSAELATSSAR